MIQDKEISHDGYMKTIETIIKNPVTGKRTSFKGDTIEDVNAQIDKTFGTEE